MYVYIMYVCILEVGLETASTKEWVPGWRHSNPDTFGRESVLILRIVMHTDSVWDSVQGGTGMHARIPTPAVQRDHMHTYVYT
jgi:hypothetical protein